jgi:hypothetical protein
MLLPHPEGSLFSTIEHRIEATFNPQDIPCSSISMACSRSSDGTFLKVKDMTVTVDVALPHNVDLRSFRIQCPDGDLASEIQPVTSWPEMGIKEKETIYRHSLFQKELFG